LPMDRTQADLRSLWLFSLDGRSLFKTTIEK
jgi:hypothetical protein